jgi:hypothetical protein
MTFGEIHYGKYRKRRVLRNIKVEEVSSVDRGAGHGVRVMLMKRDAPRASEVRPWDGTGLRVPDGQLGDRGFRYVQKEDTPMREYSEHSLVSVAKGLTRAVEKGLDGETFAKMQIELASQMWPNEPTPYHALAKLLETNIGKSMTAKATQANYERMQWQSKSGDGFEAVQKMNKAEPHVHFDDDRSGAVVDGDDPDLELAKLGEAYRRQNPQLKLSPHQAITHVIEHTDAGRAAFQRSKARDVAKNAAR